MLKRTIIIVSPFLTVLLTVMFYFGPSGFSRVTGWLCLMVFYIYFYETIKPIRIVSSIPVLLNIRFMLHVFIYFVYYLPYQLALLGLFDIESVNTVRGYSYIEGSNASLVSTTLGVVLLNFLYYVFKSVGVGFKGEDSSRTHVSVDSYVVMLLVSVFCGAMVSVNLILNGHVLFASQYSGSDLGGLEANAVYNFARITSMWLGALFVYHRFIREKITITMLVLITPSLLWMMILLALGDRNEFLLIASVYAVGYATYVRKISFKVVLVGLVSLLLLYEVVGVARKVVDDSLMSVATDVIMERSDAPFGANSFKNTTVISRAVYAYVPDHYPYEYGRSLIISTASIIPYLGGVTKSYLGSDADDVMTHALLGPNSSWGLGSSLMLGAYKNFGLLGIYVYMLALAYLILGVESSAKGRPGNPKNMAVYLVAMAVIIQLPRYDLYFLIRPLVWTWLFFVLMNNLNKILAKYS